MPQAFQPTRPCRLRRCGMKNAASPQALRLCASAPLRAKHPQQSCVTFSAKPQSSFGLHSSSRLGIWLSTDSSWPVPFDRNTRPINAPPSSIVKLIPSATAM